MHEVIHQALKLASSHHGVVSRHQLQAAGFSPSAIRLVRGSEAFDAVGPHVLRASGSADTTMRRVSEAVLDVGPEAVLSHTSAAALWGLPGFLFEPVHVIGDRGNQHRDATYLGVVHEPRLLLPCHRVILDAVPVTSPARTIFDLANLGLHRRRVERALDAAWARNLVNQRSIEQALRQLAKRGRQGIAVMRDLIEDRRDNYTPPESGLEHRFQEVLERHGLPPMRRQIDVGDGEQWVGRIDFVADDGLPLLVRVQSARYHSALVDQRLDALKNARLRAAGWEVIEVTDVEVFHRPSVVAQRVGEGYRAVVRRLPRRSR